MKLLLNENIGASIVAALRDSGLDAAWVAETSVGLADRAVIERAFREDRVLVTKDKDFGEFVFKSGIPHRGLEGLSRPKGRLLCRRVGDDAPHPSSALNQAFHHPTSTAERHGFNLLKVLEKIIKIIKYT